MQLITSKALKTYSSKILVLFIVFLAFSHEALASQTFTSVKSGLWTDPTVWTAAGNGAYPGQFDNVVIKSGHTIILNVSTEITRNFIIEAGAVLRGDGTGKTLVIGKDNKDDDFTNLGTIDFSSPYTAGIKLDRASEWTGGGTYNLSTLDLNNATLNFTAGSVMTLNFSGATPITNFGYLNSLPGIHFNFNGTVPQTLPAANITYGSIEINNPAGVTLSSNLSGSKVLGDLTINSGNLNTNDNTIIGNASSTLTIGAAGTLNLSGVTSVKFPTGFGTYDLEPGSVVNYSASAFQEIAPIAYTNLVISGLKSGTTTTFGSWPVPSVASCQNLTVESNVDFNLNRNFTIQQTLTLNGHLTVGAYTLTLNGGPVQGTTANLIASSSSTLVLGGSSSGVTIPSGVSALKSLVINNSSVTGVNLLAPLTLNHKLQFNTGKLYLNLSNLTVLNPDSVVGADSTKYVVTNNNPIAGGFLIMPIANNLKSYLFPVGTSTSYAPAILKLSAASVADNFKIRVFDQVLTNGLTGSVISKYVVNKTWLIEESVIGGSDASIKLGWLTKDQATGFDPTKTGTSHYTGGKWDHTTTWASSVAGGGVKWRERSGFTSFSPFTVVDRNLVDVVVNLKVFLQGPYNTATGLMSTSLNSLGYLPLTQPYNGSPWNYAGTETVAAGFFAANPTIVDWVLLELRTSTAAATSIKKQAAFLKSNGEIVGVDGASLPILKDVESGSYYVVIRHRNHLPAMSADRINISSSSVQYDFTNDLNKFYQADCKLIGSNKYAMHAGDANGNGNIKYSGTTNDKTSLQQKVGFSTLTKVINGYHKEDLNMNGNVKYSGSANDKTLLQTNVGFSTLTKVLTTKLPN